MSPIGAPTPVPILGWATATPDDLVALVRPVNLSFVDLEAVAEAFVAIGATYGVRGDIAFCQAIHETGWFRFGGDVRADQHNYAGIGAVGGGAAGASFPSVEAGVAAQIQHLYAYATTAPLPAGEPIVDPRFDLVARSSAPTWQALDGRWAVPGDGYGEAILAIYARLPVREGDVLMPTTPVRGNRVTLDYDRPPPAGKRYSNRTGRHSGVDIGEDRTGQGPRDDLVRATDAGVVITAAYDVGGLGYYVKVRHVDGYSWYCHLARYIVSVGQRVHRGTPVGVMGATGNVNGKHLHYQETSTPDYQSFHRPRRLRFAGYGPDEPDPDPDLTAAELAEVRAYFDAALRAVFVGLD